MRDEAADTRLRECPQSLGERLVVDPPELTFGQRMTLGLAMRRQGLADLEAAL